MDSRVKDIKENFSYIEKKLNKDLIGQEKFLKKLCNYFENKILENDKGILFIIGEKDTAKKTSVRLLFDKLEKVKLIENSNLDEIDLSSYNFNLGYNAFLTDLYEGLNSNSQGLLFKNFDKATKEMLEILSSISPNECVNLKDNYTIKNKFLIECDDKDKEGINKLVCPNKFFIFTSNKEDIDISELFDGKFLKKIETVLHTKKLNESERKLIIRKEVNKFIIRIEEEFGVKVTVQMEENNKMGEDLGICNFFQENYREDSSFGISEYVAYRLYNPIRSLIIQEEVEKENVLILYIENNRIYCKVDKDIFKLSEYSTPTLDEVKYKLNSIIGMKGLKDFIDNIQNSYKVQKIRERLGLKTSHISMNMIFAGNAGTGKTNAARITYEYLNALGILKEGKFREVSKADFVSENLNDIAKRTNDIVNSALGGLLFIDEAYSLCESEDDKAGKEIVDALLKGIEDNRNNLIVILAGYEKDMEKFISINPGLKSRFPNVIHFEDYSPSEMYQIAVKIAKSKGYRIAKNVKYDLIELFAKNQIIGKNDLGNARFVRNIVENAIMDASKKYLNSSEKQIDLLERDNFNFKAKTKFDLEERLKDIVGLDEVKKLLRSQYKLIAAQEKRKSAGVNTKIEQNLNMVFAGNPGTGKTSIARVVADMLNSMGLLKVGQLIETDRSSFVSEIPGETSKKTEAKFKEAICGILFIDEAYTLANDSLGREAIETLLKLIEDYSKEVIVILAGYEEEMEEFFDVNIGLRSRFPLWTNFEDYNPNELLEMSIKLIESKGFRLSKNAYGALKKSFVDIYEKSDSQSGNGRMVRNYVENIIRNQSIRIVEEDISAYEMNLITIKDIEAINVSEYSSDFDLEKKLKSLIASEKSKEFLRNQYKFMKTKEKREKLGKRSDINKYMNMVFTGEIGTGKKTVLNILSEMYYSMGIVKAKSIIEIDENEIISMLNKGMQLEDILNKFLGKVVLIDKAHLLKEENSNKEIVASLIKFLDKNKNKIVIVLSGEKNPMKDLILKNQSLNYRFPIWFDFEDYTSEELLDITLHLIKTKGFSLDEQGESELKNVVSKLYNTKNLGLKNGLMIKKYLDNLVRIQSIRVSNENISSKEIDIINKEDIRKSEEVFINRNEIDFEIDLECNKDAILKNEEKLYDYSITEELTKLNNLLSLKIIDNEEFKILKSRLIR